MRSVTGATESMPTFVSVEVMQWDYPPIAC